MSYGQDEVVPDLKPYESLTDGLFVSKVIELPNKTQKEISTQFKNWASTSFVNLREIMVSETESQIVLNYITDTYSYMKLLGIKNPIKRGWYVRLVAQFKEGKMRIQFYDDGNTFIPGSYSQYGSTPATQARTMFIRYSNTKPESFAQMHRTKFYYDLHYQWQQNVNDMIVSCEKGLRDNSLVARKDDF